ncbi:MAG: DUF5106 domain-containing protein [Alistipes sp.]|nr:DUF5106 domain-containing protein [Alistipes sp.]
MKNILYHYAIILAAFSFFGCLGGQRASSVNIQEQAVRVPEKIKIPDVPAMMTSPEDVGRYLALHYWDNFDFTDTLYVEVPEITEQAFVDYLAIVGMNPPQTARESVAGVIDRAASTPQVFHYFTRLFEEYLDDYGSAMRSEELYILVLECIVASDKVDELDKLRPQARLNAAYKNRMGTTANDLVLTEANGRRLRLHDIKADFILLYFNNPDCIHCEEVTTNIKASNDMLIPLQRQGVLKILAIYPDEDLDAWHRHYEDMPSEWIRTYDKELSIRREQTYDLRAIPSLYLLDRDKTVLLKDLDQVWQIENFFAMQGY